MRANLSGLGIIAPHHFKGTGIKFIFNESVPRGSAWEGDPKGFVCKCVPEFIEKNL
jgi:hypothetical protein